MEFKIPEKISINDRTYEFNDCSITPAQAKEYIQLIKESLELDKATYFASYLEE